MENNDVLTVLGVGEKKSTGKAKIHLKNAAFKSLNRTCPNRTFGYPSLGDNRIFPSLLAMIKVWIKQEDRKFKVSLNSIHKRGWAYQLR